MHSFLGTNVMLWSGVVSLMLCISISSVRGQFIIEDRDGHLTTPALIKKYGYRAWQHKITTSDGYQLVMHRMQRKNGSNPLLLPVLLVHGLLGSSADWVVVGPDAALGYILADAGYDVWLGNTRGNRYSRQHVTLSPDDSEFWNFSWHEKGLRDLPAIIDYILGVAALRKGSGQEQLYYIGYSEGGTIYYVLTSTLPQYNAKIRLAHTLAPAILLNDIRSPLLQALAANSPSLISMFRRTNLVELFPWSKAQNGILRTACPPSAWNNRCTTLLDNLFGPNSASLDLRVVRVFMGHCPAGAALKEVEHYNQVIHSGVFRPYHADGTECSAEPYNLTASTAPVVIYYGLNDWIVHPRNIERFAAQLPSMREILTVGGRKFNHLDFLIAKRAKEAVYSRIVYNLWNDTQTSVKTY